MMRKGIVRFNIGIVKFTSCVVKNNIYFSKI